MSQPAEIESISLSKLLEYFQVKADSMPESSLAGYRKSMSCLEKFSSTGSEENRLSEILLEDWFVYMCFRGLTVKTALHYLDLISSLYSSAVKDGIVQSTELFASIKSRVKQKACDIWKNFITEAEFAKLLNVTKTAYRQTGQLSVASDILLFSLINNAMSLTDVAMLKKDDIQNFSEESKTIAGRHADARRKYLFPLEQTQRTPRQLENHVNELVGNLLALRGIHILGNTPTTIKSYWAYAAMRSGAFASDVINALGNRPAGMPILALCSPQTQTSPAKSSHLQHTVAGIFVENPRKWFAMRLRPGVKFERVEERISDLKHNTQTPDFFYPCNEIARRIKKKIVFEQRPVLPDIAFFKSRITDIQPLFAKIGDLAWCYTGDGSYASIPDKAMELFQRAIGKFTPDYEVGPVGTIPLRKGDRIVVIGGPFMGLKGEIMNEPLDQHDVIYRIMLWGESNNIEWRVSDPRMLEKQE